MKKTFLALLLCLPFAPGAAFAAPAQPAPAPKLQQQGQDEEEIPVKQQPPVNQNYYMKGGKLFGKSVATKDAAGLTVIYYYDSAGRIAGYGRPYVGKESGNKIVKYYDKSNKYLGYSTTTVQPDGGGVTTYKLASGMVFGTSVMKYDPKTGDYTTTYFWGSGKLAGYSKRSTPQQPAAETAATGSAEKKTASPASAAQAQPKATKTAAAATSQTAASSTVTASGGGAGDPILVPAGSSSTKRKTR